MHHQIAENRKRYLMLKLNTSQKMFCGNPLLYCHLFLVEIFKSLFVYEKFNFKAILTSGSISANAYPGRINKTTLHFQYFQCFCKFLYANVYKNLQNTVIIILHVNVAFLCKFGTND